MTFGVEVAEAEGAGGSFQSPSYPYHPPPQPRNILKSAILHTPPSSTPQHHILSPVASMVRIKNRYLLVNILYPELSTLASKTPDLIAFNAPTTSELTSHLLLKAIRDAILELFGDYGAGAVASSLMSMYYLYWRRGIVLGGWARSGADTGNSKIPQHRDEHVHPPRNAQPLPPGLGSAVPHEPSPHTIQRWQVLHI